MNWQGKSNSRNKSKFQAPPKLDTSGIVLKPGENEFLPADLFDGVAQSIAKKIADSRSNRPTQVRKFYDELVMWDERVSHKPDKFQEYLPFIRMLNAKAAYANGRGHVDSQFVDLMNACLSQVTDDKTLHNFKLFFEAFIGFYKLERPKN